MLGKTPQLRGGPGLGRRQTKHSQTKLCVCGRSLDLPFCDGRHAAEDWTCAADVAAARFGFCAPSRYQNLARKLAAHYQGITCLPGASCADCETLVTLIDGSDLDFVLEANARVAASRRIVVSLGIRPENLRNLFPGSEMVDFSEINPLHAFKKISAWLDGAERGAISSDGLVLRPAFLSHAVQDEPLLLPVKDFLEHYYQADLFTCADSIRSGADWQAEIMQALRERECFVLLLSQASLGSHSCSFELGMASALGRRIHVISIDGSLPPVFIQHIQAADVQRIAHTRPWLEPQDILLEELLKILSR